MIGVLPIRSFVIILAERSDCCLVEQMTTLVLPPTVPYRAMTGMALSDSANSVRFVWLNSFIPHHYRRIVCDSVLMISCDCWAYRTPAITSCIEYQRRVSVFFVPERSCNIMRNIHYCPPPGRSEQGLVLYQSPFRKPFKATNRIDVCHRGLNNVGIWFSINKFISDGTA